MVEEKEDNVSVLLMLLVLLKNQLWLNLKLFKNLLMIMLNQLNQLLLLKNQLSLLKNQLLLLYAWIIVILV